MPGELDEVLAAFEALVRDHEVQAVDGEEEETNFRCVDCIGCTSCRFCTACERCVDCNYCDACNDCEGCTQCRECLACATCSHSTHSAYCEKSSYLTLCLDCDGCVQCFACVGLSGEEFCVLNQRYTRRAYFKKVAELRAALDARTLEGWFPPWMRDAEEPEPDPHEREAVREPDPVRPFAPSWESDREADAPRSESTDASTPRLRQPEGTRRPPEPDAPRPPPRDPPEPPELPPAEPAEPSRLDLPQGEPSPPPRPEPLRPPRVEPPPEPPEATVHPEPLTEIAAAERTGSWPPIDHEAARALDRGGSSPWDALDEDAQESDFMAPEPDTVRRPAPPPSRFGSDAGGGGRFGPKERPTSLLDDDEPAAPVDKQSLFDGLPVAGRRPEQRPKDPKPVEDTGGASRLTRGQRPTREGDPKPATKASSPGSLRAARRPRRPDR